MDMADERPAPKYKVGQVVVSSMRDYAGSITGLFWSEQYGGWMYAAYASGINFMESELRPLTPSEKGEE